MPRPFTSSVEDTSVRPELHSIDRPDNDSQLNKISALTISDDQSVDSAILERRSLAFRGPRDSWEGKGKLGLSWSTGNELLEGLQPILLYGEELLHNLEQSRPLRYCRPIQSQSIKRKEMVPPREWQTNASTVSDSARKWEYGRVFPHSLAVRPASSLSKRSPPAQGYHNPSVEDESGDNNDSLSILEAQVLREEVNFLKAKLKYLESSQNNSIPSRYQVLYRLVEASTPQTQDKVSQDDDTMKDLIALPFMDPPEIVQDQKGGAHLRCEVPLENLELHLIVNSDISFVVFRNYNRAIEPHEHFLTPRRLGTTFRQPARFAESIRPVTASLREALSTILHKKPEYHAILRDFKISGELSAPYLFIYHSRHEMHNIKNGLPCCRYSSWRKEILPKYVKYLVKPGEVLVERVDNDFTGYIARSWIVRQSRETNSIRDPTSHIMLRRPNHLHRWTIEGSTWCFDGQFYMEKKDLHFEIPEAKSQADIVSQETGKLIGVPINELDVFPLKYASDDIVTMLRNRGRTIWDCRIRKVVSYQASDQEQFDRMTDDRYIVDMKTYKSLHSELRRHRDYLDENSMSDEKPPDDQFYFLLPPRIKGYNLRRKKWYDLSADRILDVVWNRDAFHSLVMDRKQKDLIQALVVNQLEAEKSTDLIAGKGNALILLLHGGPGTGKTLTAESVAEITEKPLYRVTCGDVGTKAEDVEKYLESVLYLGRIWDCVVLLDEADIFLEQRSLEDLQRNALVSVFLRVLEYYDGIMILTSNRVGTFDEAFRSRIQLALHYPNLDRQQRFRIWQTFIDRLEKLDNDIVDVADLRDHLDILKEEKLNGRQIRNVITTARQYARWQKKMLTYEHLRDVIEVSGRFDTYLDTLHEGYTQDELAQDEGLRLKG